MTGGMRANAADQTDEALIGAVLMHASDIAFLQLYRRHAPRMLSVARRLLDSDADAEDAVQEAWLRAVRGLAGFAGQSAFRSWLLGIVVNVGRESLARRGRWVEIGLNDETVASHAQASIEPLDLERAIRALPPGYRAAFVLHDIEGFTHAEIGERCGWTSGTSKTQLFRARRAIRALLSGTLMVEEAG